MGQQVSVFERVHKAVFRGFSKRRERVSVHLILDHPRPGINNGWTWDT